MHVVALLYLTSLNSKIRTPRRARQAAVRARPPTAAAASAVREPLDLPPTRNGVLRLSVVTVFRPQHSVPSCVLLELFILLFVSDPYHSCSSALKLLFGITPVFK